MIYRLYDNRKDSFVGPERAFRTDAEAVDIYEHGVREFLRERGDLKAVLNFVGELKLIRTNDDGSRNIICSFHYKPGEATISANLNKRPGGICLS